MDIESQSKILIIEDNDTYRKMMSMRLQSSGFHILLAEDGLQGLDMIRKWVPDLVVLDLMLPLMDGHKICRLTKSDKKTRHIPIVILTSRDLDEDADMAKKCGADAFIVKTTRSEIIIDVVNRLLKMNAAQ